MARLTQERELYDRLAQLDDGRRRPGRELAAQAIDLLEQGRPLSALHVALRAMRRSARWFSLAGLIGQHVSDEIDE